MIKLVSIRDAKTHLYGLVADVAAGGEVVIVKAGKPVARLVPCPAAIRPKALGALRGRFVVPDDLDAPLPQEVLVSFER